MTHIHTYRSWLPWLIAAQEEGVLLTATDTSSEECVSSDANSPSVLVPPSTFCLWVVLYVTGRPPSEARWPPSWPLSTVVFGGSVIPALIIPAGQELPRPCSLACRVWPRTAARRKREDFQSSAHIHIPVCAKYLFHPFCLSLKITNKGKSFYYSSLSEGRLKKGWMTLVSVLSAMWALSFMSGGGWTHWGVRNEVRSCTPGSWRVKQGWDCFSNRHCQLLAFHQVWGSWRGAASCSGPCVHDLFQQGLASQQWLRRRWWGANITWQLSYAPETVFHPSDGTPNC